MQRIRLLYARLPYAVVYWIGAGLSLLVVLFFTVTVYPQIDVQWHCVSMYHCQVTIKNGGGGFYRGFNPSFPWSVQNNNAAVHLSAYHGVVLPGQTVTVQITIDVGSCPQEISIYGGDGSGVYNTAVC